MIRNHPKKTRFRLRLSLKSRGKGSKKPYFSWIARCSWILEWSPHVNVAPSQADAGRHFPGSPNMRCTHFSTINFVVVRCMHIMEPHTTCTVQPAHAPLWLDAWLRSISKTALSCPFSHWDKRKGPIFDNDDMSLLGLFNAKRKIYARGENHISIVRGASTIFK